MEIIGLEVLSKKYGYKTNHFRTILCRPEFNKYRTDKNFYFNDCNEFHQEVKNIIKLKKRKRSNAKLKTLLLILLCFNCQTAFCQHYEPVIIYNQFGEPQTVLKGRIIYDYYGVPKFNK